MRLIAKQAVTAISTLLICHGGLLQAQQQAVVSVAEPTNALQLSRHLSLPEPLSPIVDGPAADETSALAAAVTAWDKRTRGDDFSALEAFVAGYPQSSWTPSVQLNLGLLYYRGGYFSRAISAFNASWQAARLGSATSAQTLASRAAAELAVMHARVGHMDELKALLEETKIRTFRGNAKVQIDRAAEGLQAMENKPEVSFRCGPYALSNIAGLQNIAVPEPFLRQTASTAQGFSLLELKTMAHEKLGMSTQVVKRAAGGAVPVPSVMHFKCLHFGALVKQEGGDHFMVKDPTFGNDTWMTIGAVEDESSGYFLIPEGPLPEGCSAVADEEAGALFGRGHSGSGDLGATNCGNQQVPSSCSTNAVGMAGYSIHLMRVSLAVTDTPIALPAPYGSPIALTCAYHQREADRPAMPAFTHFGEQWVSNWVSWLNEDTSNPAADIKLFLPGGGYEIFSGYTSSTQRYTRSRTSGLLLCRVDAGSYELRMQDGSRLVYSRTTALNGQRMVFLSQEVDAWGNTTTINYSTDPAYPFRIDNVASASGRALYFFYAEAGDPFAVTQVTDNSVLANAYKKAVFTYQTVDGIKQLRSITDPVGIQSGFTYDASGFLNSLTTPYGTTAFATGNPQGSASLPRSVTATDPQGASEKVEYRVDVLPVMPAGLPGGVNTITSFDWDDRNTFYWSKVAFKVGANDPSKAHIYHWLQKDGADFTVSTLEREKPALQEYIWYNYPGQTSGPYNAGTAPTPSAVGTVVEGADGTLQSAVTTSTYHSTSGNLTQQTDASGLQTRYTYGSVTGADTANPGTDVTKIEVFDPATNTWVVVKNVTQYQNHEPVVYTDEQGITTTRTLNAKGQTTQISRSSTAAGSTRTESARLTYTSGPADAVPAWSSTATGYLRKLEVTDPVNAGAFVTVAQYSYDANGRLLTATDAEGYTLTYSYDALDRVTQTQHPDGTTETVEYSQDGHTIIAPTKFTGRDGRSIRHRYNALGQRMATIDAMQQPTFFDWCLCGDLKKLTDAKGQVTTWRHDIQGRITAKINPNGDTTTYQFYPASGQLKSVTLPNAQAAGTPTYTLSYDAQGHLVKQDYADANTADVTFSGFDYLGRATQMTDGLGTTAYTFLPLGQSGGGQLYVMDGPLGNDALRYTFTHFGRRLRTENVTEPVTTGSTVRQFMEHAYDLMGRASSLTTDMGLSSLGYQSTNVTAKPDSITHRVGGVDAVRSSFGYYTDAANLGRLENITHAFASGGTWSTQVQHDYGYDVSARITSWRWRSPAFSTQAAIDRRWQAGYDAADQLQSVTSYSADTTTVLEQWGYAYDAAGNRSYEEHAGTGIISQTGQANRLQQRGGGGNLRVSGTVDKAASVTVNGQPARVTSTAGAAPFRFEKDLAVGSGAQTFSIVATDGSTPPQTTTKSYQVNVPAESQTYEHDRNGNLLAVRSGGSVIRAYTWDAANRLVGITYTDGGTTTFQYDGMSQRRVITEKDATGTVTGTTRLLWKSGRVWQEQDSSGRVTKCYHFNGVQTLTYTGASTTPDSTTSTLTLTDHLGSHREMVTFSGGTPAITGRRDFDPYGKVTQAGTVPTNAAYTGHWLHDRSGLELALYRAYDPELGRWLNEDPLGEKGGLNLYGYVGNASLIHGDKFGLYVDMLFDLSEGKLTATDTNTGEKLVISGIVSGSGEGVNNCKFENIPNKGPVPRNDYLISKNKKYDAYNLLGMQKPGWDYDTNEISGGEKPRYGNKFYPPHGDRQRSDLMIHELGRYSLGCMGIPANDWGKLKKMLENVKTPYHHNEQEFPGFLKVQE